MGFWNSLRKVATRVSHPVRLVKSLEHAVVKAEKNIGKNVRKAAKLVVKEGSAAVKVAKKGLDEVEKHAKDIKKVVNVVSEVVEVIGTATGQPEIVAGAAALQGAADKALDLAAKARKITNVAEKTIAVADAVAQKKKLSVIMHKTADAMNDAASLSGNKQLREMAGHVKKGAKVVDSAVDHAKDVITIARDTARAAAAGDIAGVVKQVGKGVKKQKQLKKYRSELQALVDEARRNPSEEAQKAAEIAQKLITLEERAEGQTETIRPSKVKSTKKSTKKSTTKGKKRAPSKYNLFVSAKRKEGFTMKEISPLWAQEKAKKQ